MGLSNLGKRPSLFAQYKKEREGIEIIEKEHGFATYYPMEGYMYIEDIYVVPEKRHTGLASKMADEVAEIAKSAGYSKLLGSVVPSKAGSTIALKALLGYGYKLLAAQSDALWLYKEIG
jgi:predicted GNAT family acetyltransferase